MVPKFFPSSADHNKITISKEGSPFMKHITYGNMLNEKRS